MRKYVENIIDFTGYKALIEELKPSTFEVTVEGSEVYHPLEAGYIPIDNVSLTVNDSGKIQLAGNADWSVPEGSNGYIKNRTHYKDKTEILKETFKADEEKGTDYPEVFYIEHNFQEPPIASPECWGWHYYYDESEPDGGKGAIKARALIDTLKKYPDGTVFKAKLNIYDKNLDKSVDVEENLTLHITEINKTGEGYTVTGEYVELYADYFFNEIQQDPGTGIWGPLLGPGLYLGASNIVENNDGQDPSINLDFYLGLHNPYFTQEIVDKNFEGEDPSLFVCNADFTKETLVKLDKEYIPQTSDWNVNDEESPDFIKNRTHYRTEDTQEDLGFFSLTGGSKEEIQTTSGHDVSRYYLGDYVYRSSEGDNTLFNELRETFNALDQAWNQGIRKINLKLDNYDENLYSCNLYRTYDDSKSHQRYTTYTLTLDNAESAEDADNIFDKDQNLQGDTVISKGVLFRVCCYSYDQV